MHIEGLYSIQYMILLFFYLYNFDVIVVIVMVVIICYNKIYCVLDDFFSL